MTQQAHETTVASIDDLEARLRQLEYYLSGSDDAQPTLEAAVSKGKDHTVMARLSTLEHKLHNMSEGSLVVRSLLQIRQSTHTHFADPEIRLTVS